MLPDPAPDSASAPKPEAVRGRAGAVDFLAAAVSAGPERREALWRANREDSGNGAELRTALLQSLPGHSGYDPGAARRRLRASIVHDPKGDGAALARLRLAELGDADECREDLQQMRRRLAKVIDIERKLDEERR